MANTTRQQNFGMWPDPDIVMLKDFSASARLNPQVLVRIELDVPIDPGNWKALETAIDGGDNDSAFALVAKKLDPTRGPRAYAVLQAAFNQLQPPAGSLRTTTGGVPAAKRRTFNRGMWPDVDIVLIKDYSKPGRDEPRVCLRVHMDVPIDPAVFTNIDGFIKGGRLKSAYELISGNLTATKPRASAVLQAAFDQLNSSPRQPQRAVNGLTSGGRGRSTSTRGHKA